MSARASALQLKARPTFRHRWTRTAAGPRARPGLATACFCLLACVSTSGLESVETTGRVLVVVVVEMQMDVDGPVRRGASAKTCRYR